MDEDLQTVIDSLASTATGDVDVVVPVNYQWQKTLVLRNRPNNYWVTIRGPKAFDPNVRVTPADAVNMPKLSIDNEQAVITSDIWNTGNHAGAAHHYRFVALEVTATSSMNWNLMVFGTSKETDVADLPHDIQILNCYIHGAASGEMVRGIMFSGSAFTVRSSYISGFKSTFMEANAIGVINSPGQIDIENNYLEAAAENVCVDGSTETIHNLIPDGITVKHNYFFKPTEWRGTDTLPQAVYVKNHLEFKNGKNIVIDSNVFENIWYQNQDGSFLLLTPRTGDGFNEANVVSNVTVTNNIFRHGVRGISGHTIDPNHGGVDPSLLAVSSGWTIKNNLFADLGAAAYSIPNDFAIGIVVTGPPAPVDMENNTVQFRSDETRQPMGLWLVGYTQTLGITMKNNDWGSEIGADARYGVETVTYLDWLEQRRHYDGYGWLYPLASTPSVWQNNVVYEYDQNHLNDWLQAFPSQKFATDGTVGADVNGLVAGETKIKQGTY